MNTDTKWKGNDVDMLTSIEDYGFVYKFDGENFDVYTACTHDENGMPIEYANWEISIDAIQDYFDDNGESIANMCGVKVNEMDWEWKLDALLSYYGAHEFMGSYYKPISKDELIELVERDGWA